MNWDASRISAAIPSGVGFLGAGLIFKKEEKDSSLVVHGLTTAASVWISAAVGIACGGELYFASSFGVALMMLLLRFGPRSFEFHDDESENEEDDTVSKLRGFTPSERLKTVVIQADSSVTSPSRRGTGVDYESPAGGAAYGSVHEDQDLEASLRSAQETTPMIRLRNQSKSIRNRASLASMV
jgi:uncharacterized membrane protein YhiD involved in acid resistance